MKHIQFMIKVWFLLTDKDAGVYMYRKKHIQFSLKLFLNLQIIFVFNFLEFSAFPPSFIPTLLCPINFVRFSNW